MLQDLRQVEPFPDDRLAPLNVSYEHERPGINARHV